MDPRENRSAAVAWLALCGLAGLACVSAIGAITALAVMTLDKSAPSPNPLAVESVLVAGVAKSRVVVDRLARAPQSGERAMVMWQAGKVFCVRDRLEECLRPQRDGLVMVVQAELVDK